MLRREQRERAAQSPPARWIPPKEQKDEIVRMQRRAEYERSQQQPPTFVTREQAIAQQRSGLARDLFEALALQRQIETRKRTIDPEVRYEIPLSYFVPDYKGEGTRIVYGSELYPYETEKQADIKEYIEQRRGIYVESVKDIGAYPSDIRGVPVKFIPTKTGYDIKYPTSMEVHEHLHPGARGQSVIAAGIVQEWGIPAAVSIGIRSFFGIGPFGKAKGVAEGIDVELERQAEKSVRLTRREGESIEEHFKRFWTSPETIESVYLPVATMGIGYAYTAVKAGATGATTIGKLAKIGVKYGPKATKTFERGLLGMGMVGAGVGGVHIGYTYAVAPERGPSAIGQFAHAFAVSMAGFKLGEVVATKQLGIPTKKIPGLIEVKKGDIKVRRLDVDLTKDIPKGVIEPIDQKMARWEVIWKPKEPTYGIKKIYARGLATSEGTKPIDVVFSKGKATITYEGQRGLIFKKPIIREMDLHGLKIAITGTEYGIPFKSTQIGETISSYIKSITVGVIGKKGYPSTVEFDLLGGGNKYIKGLTEAIPAETHPMWSRGKYIGISKGPEKILAFGKIKQAMTISVLGEKAFFGKDIGTTGITSETGISPGALTYAQKVKFKMLTGADLISTAIAKSITGQSMATATLRGALPSLTNIQKFQQIYHTEKFQKIGETELQRIGWGNINIQKMVGGFAIQKIGETELQRTGEVTQTQRVQQMELQEMKMQQIQEMKMQQMQQMQLQKLQQTKLQQIKPPPIFIPPIIIPPFIKVPWRLFGLGGDGTSGFGKGVFPFFYPKGYRIRRWKVPSMEDFLKGVI